MEAIRVPRAPEVVRERTRMPRDGSGRLQRRFQEGTLDGRRFGRPPTGDVVAIGPARPTVLFGGRGVYPGGVVVLPGESALRVIRRGRYDGCDATVCRGPIVGLAPTDPRLWPMWAGRTAGAGTGLASGGAPVDAAGPMDAATARALGLVVRPSARLVGAAGFEATDDWDEHLTAGIERLASGDAAGAVEALRRRVDSHPGDFSARRLLGVALVESGDVAAGGWRLLEAYRASPELARRALGLELFASAGGRGGARRARAILRDAVRWAHREDDASAWLVAAVMAQAEARERVAARMLREGESVGLDPIIGAAFGTSP